jgi:hypothetical protein
MIRFRGCKRGEEVLRAFRTGTTETFMGRWARAHENRNLFRHRGRRKAGLKSGGLVLPLLFLTLSWRAGKPGTGFAFPPNPSSPSESSASNANVAGGHPGDAGRATPAGGRRPSSAAKNSELHRSPARAVATIPLPKPASPVKTLHPVPPARGRQLSPHGNSLHSRPPGWDGPGNAARSGWAGNPAAHNPASVHRSSVGRSAAPSFSTVPHRNPNPAVVSGAANVRGRNGAGINGTRMTHKL